MAEDLPGFTVCSLPRRLCWKIEVTKRRLQTRAQHDASVLVVQLHRGTELFCYNTAFVP